MVSETPETATAEVKTPRRSGKIDLASGTVTVGGVRYERNELPAITQLWVGLYGMRRRLLNAKNPADAWAELVAGKLPSDGAAKPKELDPWRRAYGHAWADKQAKDRGIKAKSPEYAGLLDEGLAAGAALDRAGLTNAKRIPAVVMHWNKITGNEATL